MAPTPEDSVSDGGEEAQEEVQDSGMGEALKRRREDGEPNWSDEDEMERLLEKKRRREEAEPYNAADARRKAREVGKQEARRSSVSVKSQTSNKAPPFRLLSIPGDSSSEFVSVDGDAAPPPLPSITKEARREAKRLRKTWNKHKKQSQWHDYTMQAAAQKASNIRELNSLKPVDRAADTAEERQKSNERRKARLKARRGAKKASAVMESSAPAQKAKEMQVVRDTGSKAHAAPAPNSKWARKRAKRKAVKRWKEQHGMAAVVPQTA